MYYRLEGKKIIRCKDLKEATELGAWDTRRVALTEEKNIRVSTVFLVIDHSFGPLKEDAPIVFETMAFRNNSEIRCNRYATWDEAVEGHKRVCKELLGYMPIDVKNIALVTNKRVIKEDENDEY